jgi:FOG: WD40 repeat
MGNRNSCSSPKKSKRYQLPKTTIHEGEYNVPDGPCYGVGLTPDSRILVTTHDNSIKYWDLKTKRVIYTIERAHHSTIYSLTMSNNGTTFITGSKGNTVKIWSVDKPQELHKFKNITENCVFEVKLTNDNNYFLARCGYEEEAHVQFWNIRKKSLIKSFPLGNALCIAIAPNDEIFACSSWSEIKVWDLRTKELVSQMRLIDTSVIIRSLVFTNDGEKIITGSNAWLKIWDVGSGNLIHTIEHQSKLPLTLLKMLDDETMISASDDGVIGIWNIEEKRLIDSFVHNENFKIRSRYQDPKPRITFSASKDKKTLVTASNEGLIKIWDLPSRKCVHTLFTPRITDDS